MSDQAPEPRQLTDSIKAEIRSAYAAIKAALPGFRDRKSQLQMIAGVSRILAVEGGSGIIEAPTGTGKSLSYLTAAIPIARLQKLQVVVSTGTVALQEQLADRDVPLFLKATKYPITVAVAKGRGRFACPKRMAELTQGDGQDFIDFGDGGEDLNTPAWPRAPRPGEADKVSRLNTAWEVGAWNGDLDKTPEPIDSDLMPLLSISAGACANTRCSFYRQCPFMQARAKVKKADLVVTNHSLLLADLRLAGNEEGESGGVLLPKPSDCLIIVDEGHHLPEKARDATQASVHMASSRRRQAKLRNVVRAAYQALGKQEIAKLSLNDGHKLIGDIDQAMARLQERVAVDWSPSAQGEDPPMWRAPVGKLPHDWRLQSAELETLSRKCSSWISALRRQVTDNDALGASVRDPLLRELGIAAERVSSDYALWAAWSREEDGSDPPVARWITLTKDGALVLHACAVSAADFLSENLFGQAAGVVLTSATISAGGDFTAVARDVGLPEEAETVSLPSPFDLRRNATLVVPKMRSLPNDRDAHSLECASWMAANLDWDAGNLVIFTSRAKMDKVYAALPPACQAKSLVQGSKSKSQLLADHSSAISQGKGSTLLGMLLAGEGLDLPGALCTTVVITSLPFSVPTDPVGATLSEWLEARGRRPFDEVSVPHATRVLTQFSGRLLRHEDDTGRVVILDSRLLTKGYGRRMIDALPPFSRQLGT